MAIFSGGFRMYGGVLIDKYTDPSAPSNIVANWANSTVAVLSYTGSAFDGGGSLRYTAVSNVAGASNVSLVSANTITVNGVTSNASQIFTLYSTNGYHSSPNVTSNIIMMPTAANEVLFSGNVATSWTVPAGVYKISIVAIGAGGRGGYISGYNGGGGGGGLTWINDYTVTPGQSFNISIAPPTIGGGTSSGASPDGYTETNFRSGGTVLLSAGRGDSGENSRTEGYGSLNISGSSSGGSWTGAGWSTYKGWGYPGTLYGHGGGEGGPGYSTPTTNDPLHPYKPYRAGGGIDGGGGGPIPPGNEWDGGGAGGGSGSAGTGTSVYGANAAANTRLYGYGGGGSNNSFPGNAGGDGAVRIMWGGGRSFPYNANSLVIT